MKKLVFTLMGIFFIVLSCKKGKTPTEEKEVIKGNIKQVTETINGITYKIFTDKNATNFKGILVVGSGNAETNPSEGSINGAAETALCEKAAANGYAAAIVKYRKTPGFNDWNTSATMLGDDYDKCIVAIANKYNIDKSKSVIAGFSYSTYLLFTYIAYNDKLNYCKGLLAACASTDQDKINRFKIPVLSLTGKDESEGDATNFTGATLYSKIPANSLIKARSEGFSDPNSTGHCQGNWTDKMYSKMIAWLQ